MRFLRHFIIIIINSKLKMPDQLLTLIVWLGIEVLALHFHHMPPVRPVFLAHERHTIT